MSLFSTCTCVMHVHACTCISLCLPLPAEVMIKLYHRVAIQNSSTPALVQSLSVVPSLLTVQPRPVLPEPHPPMDRGAPRPLVQLSRRPLTPSRPQPMRTLEDYKVHLYSHYCYECMYTCVCVCVCVYVPCSLVNVHEFVVYWML